MNADTNRQIQCLAIGRFTASGENPLDGEGRQQRAPYMVLLCDRCPKHRHEAIAGKLRRRATIATDLGQARLEKGLNKVPHRFGSKAFSQRSGVDDVAEQYGDLFHFAGERAAGVQTSGVRGMAYRGSRRGGLLQTRTVQWRPAVTAEFMLRRIAGSA